MKIKVLSITLFLLTLISCNPYKGFSGVDDKGMGRKPPSVEMTESFEKSQKKSNRHFKKEMRKRKKKFGSEPSKKK